LRVWFWLLVCTIFALSKEDFISEFEYGQMLYKNPRGVSCAKCHGELGEGAYIASLINEDNIKINFYGPDIRPLNLKTFKNAIFSGGRIMPKYYLTNKEIEAIYKYIKIVNNYEKPVEKIEDNNSNLPQIEVDEEEYLIEDNITKESNTILNKIFKIEE